MNIKQKITNTIFVLLSSFIVAGTASSVGYAACGGVDTAIINCTQGGGGGSTTDSGVWGILLLALNILTAGVGILAVGGIVFGAILYASAEENASQIQKAKDIIKNVVLGLVAYGAMYLILNFLIPGGIFQ